VHGWYYSTHQPVSCGNQAGYDSSRNLTQCTGTQSLTVHHTDGITHRESCDGLLRLFCAAVLCCAPAGTNVSLPVDRLDRDGLKTSQPDGRLVMGPVWDAAKAMGLCCGFPVEGEGATGIGCPAMPEVQCGVCITTGTGESGSL
jgi:hypothetical protein